MAFFGVDLWNPKNMGTHSTDEKSRDQWVKREVVYVRVGLCMNLKKIKKARAHVAPNVAICCVGMLRSFGRGLKVHATTAKGSFG